LAPRGDGDRLPSWPLRPRRREWTGSRPCPESSTTGWTSQAVVAGCGCMWPRRARARRCCCSTAGHSTGGAGAGSSSGSTATTACSRPTCAASAGARRPAPATAPPGSPAMRSASWTPSASPAPMWSATTGEDSRPSSSHYGIPSGSTGCCCPIRRARGRGRARASWPVCGGPGMRGWWQPPSWASAWFATRGSSPGSCGWVARRHCSPTRTRRTTPSSSATRPGPRRHHGCTGTTCRRPGLSYCDAPTPVSDCRCQPGCCSAPTTSTSRSRSCRTSRPTATTSPRQRVQFGPQQHRGPGAIGQDAHDSRPADARLDRAAILLQLPGDALGRAVLLVRQLGMLMQILVERFLAGLEAVVTGQDLLETALTAVPPYSMSSSRRLVLASSTSSLPSPDRTVRVAYSVKPLTSP
jgi:hypothetical protein